MLTNQIFNQFQQSPTTAMADRVANLKANGHQIISLQIGDPDFATPTAIMNVATKALQDGHTHYAPSRGIPEMRLAAEFRLKRDQDLVYNPDSEILVTHGGIHAYYLALQSILNPGDEVLIPDPSWPTHTNMVKLLRGIVIRVPAPSENKFLPTLDSWKKSVSPKTRAIVLNYPSNPTGAYPSREYLEKLHTLASKHDLWIVNDEVYDNLYYEDKPVSVGGFPGVKDRTILIKSLSKTYAMTGWRIGYLAAPKQVIDNALKASQNSITCVAPFVQKAAAFALRDAGVEEAISEMRTAYTRRRELVLKIRQEYSQSPVGVTPPQGAFYFFLDMRALKIDSLEICERILTEQGVGLMPGSSFGDLGRGFVRMTIAASDEDVEAGFRAILDWAGAQVGR